MPSVWDSYRVVPPCVEFWQGRPNRLHDRFVYVRASEGGPSEDGEPAAWPVNRLAP